MRVIIELIVTVLVILVARAILTSLMGGIARASSQAFSQTNQPGQQNRASRDEKVTGELHKDPVCGTYVAESSAFRKQLDGRTFYYCSERCREKHAVAAR